MLALDVGQKQTNLSSQMVRRSNSALTEEKTTLQLNVDAANAEVMTISSYTRKQKTGSHMTLSTYTRNPKPGTPNPNPQTPTPKP